MSKLFVFLVSLLCLAGCGGGGSGNGNNSPVATSSSSSSSSLSSDLAVSSLPVASSAPASSVISSSLSSLANSSSSSSLALSSNSSSLILSSSSSSDGSDLTAVVVATEASFIAGGKLARDADGNLYVANIIHTSTFNDIDGNPQPVNYFVAKYDANLNNLFHREYPTLQLDQVPSIKALEVDAEGNLWVLRMEDTEVGRVVDSLYPRDGLQFPYVHKLDSNGESLDEFSLAICDIDLMSRQTVNDFAIDGEGNLLITGYCRWSYGMYAFLAKYTATGELLFNEFILNDGTHTFTETMSLSIDEDDNIYVVGNTFLDLDGKPNQGGSISNGGGGGSTNFYDLFFIKYDKNGERLYTTTVGRQYVTVTPVDMGLAPDNKVWVAGETRGVIGERRYGGDDYFVMQFDGETGNQEFVHQYGVLGNGGDNTDVSALMVDEEGNAYVFGHNTGGIVERQPDDERYIEPFVAKYNPVGELEGIKAYGGPGIQSLTLGSVLNGENEMALLVKTTQALPEQTYINQLELFKDDLDFSADLPDPGEGGGNDGEDEDTELDWKNNWLFVQSDMAVQYRLAKVREEGPHFIFRIQYHVNSSDPIYHPASQGYHLFNHTDNGVKYFVYFPASFEGVDRIYELEDEIAVFVNGTDVEWDETRNVLVYHNWMYLPSSYSSCVDSNSSTSRCERSFGWNSNAVGLNRYTAQ
jgi:hypothetical protein